MNNYLKEEKFNSNSLFKNSLKGSQEVISNEFLKVKDKLAQRTIVDEINEDTSFEAVEITPFSETKYENLDDMLEIIQMECQKDGKRYIYAYDKEPDHTMHDLGPDDVQVKELIQIRNDKVEELCSKLQDTILIIIADHGHKLVEPIHLEEQYPEIMSMLERTTSLEPRAVSFKVKDGYQEEFRKVFKQKLGNDLGLYDKQEVIDSHLFGDGEENELFREAIGDFIAIAENSNKCILTKGDTEHKSQHAGYSDDEIYVPLIVIDKT